TCALPIFLGLASRLNVGEVRLDVPLELRARMDLDFHEQRLSSDLSEVSEILRGTFHLYHRAPEEWMKGQSSPSVAFFNPRLADPLPDPPEKRWLFILGSEDANWAAVSDAARACTAGVWRPEIHGRSASISSRSE